jgi:hypothetical protein
MATVTPQLEQETRRAWAEYAESLQGLEGAEYDRAEQDAWEQLQASLDALGAGAGAPDLENPAVG